MKKILLSLALMGSISAMQGQPVSKEKGFTVSAIYNREFVLGGFVQVREWELTGDKIELHHLGMDNFSTAGIEIKNHYSKNRSLTFTFESSYLRGKSTFDREIAYNGTLIEGNRGIDVSPTKFYRARLVYSGFLADVQPVTLNYLAGLHYDYIKFYLDGRVAADSPRSEVYESFYRQALPYPVLGIAALYPLKNKQLISLEVSGTYIPKFRSFFKEGGHMYLQYSTLTANLGYTREIGAFSLAGGVMFRHLHLFQESTEDTNDLGVNTAAPFVRAGFRF